MISMDICFQQSAYYSLVFYQYFIVDCLIGVMVLGGYMIIYTVTNTVENGKSQLRFFKMKSCSCLELVFCTSIKILENNQLPV